MAIFDIFSKRQKRAREAPDVFVYDEIPSQLRVQVVHIVRDAIGENGSYGEQHARDAYQLINDVLCREYGQFELMKYPNSHAESVFNHFLGTNEVEKALDFIELAFRVIDRVARVKIPIQHKYQNQTR